MCFYHFDFFFWWSIKFPQRNINQSETGTGGPKLLVELYNYRPLLTILYHEACNELLGHGYCNIMIYNIDYFLYNTFLPSFHGHTEEFFLQPFSSSNKKSPFLTFFSRYLVVCTNLRAFSRFCFTVRLNILPKVSCYYN